MKNLALVLLLVMFFVCGMLVHAGVEQNAQLSAEYHADLAEWQK
jgi:hypothetical protein